MKKAVKAYHPFDRQRKCAGCSSETVCICLVVTTYAQAPCLHARQGSFVYIWVTCHRGIQGLEDRLWLSVIRLLLWALFLLIPGLWHEGSLYLHSTGWHMDISYQAVCVFPTRCVWSLFVESVTLVHICVSAFREKLSWDFEGFALQTDFCSVFVVTVCWLLMSLPFISTTHLNLLKKKKSERM